MARVMHYNRPSGNDASNTQRGYDMAFNQHQRVAVRVPFKSNGVQMRPGLRCRVLAPLKGDKLKDHKGQIGVVIIEPQSEFYGRTVYAKATAFKQTFRGRPVGSVKEVEATA